MLKISGLGESANWNKNKRHFQIHQSGKISESDNSVLARPVRGSSLQTPREVAPVPAPRPSNSTPRMHPREVDGCGRTRPREGVSEKVMAFQSRLEPSSLPSWYLAYATTTGVIIFCSYLPKRVTRGSAWRLGQGSQRTDVRHKSEVRNQTAQEIHSKILTFFFNIKDM